MTHITPTGYLNLNQAGNTAPASFRISGARSLAVQIVATTWGTATARLQWSLDDENFVSFEPDIVFSASLIGQSAIDVADHYSVRLIVVTADGGADPQAALWMTTSSSARDILSVTVAGGGGAPTDATYIVQTSNATLTNEQILASLATGLVKNTTATGVLSIGVAGTDYAAASHTHAYTEVVSVPTDSVLGRDTAGTGAAEALSLDASLAFTAATTLGRAALTGDVTASAGSNATTIASNIVTYAKMQDVSAASRLIGRGSAAGAGDPQEMTVGANFSIAGTVLNLATTINVGLVVASTGVAATLVTTDTIEESTPAAGVTIDGVLLKDSLVQTNNAVPYAAMQDVSAASRLLGRGDSGAGDPQEITLGTNLSMSGTTLNAAGGSGLTHPQVMARVSMGF